MEKKYKSPEELKAYLRWQKNYIRKVMESLASSQALYSNNQQSLPNGK